MGRLLTHERAASVLGAGVAEGYAFERGLPLWRAIANHGPGRGRRLASFLAIPGPNISAVLHDKDELGTTLQDGWEELPVAPSDWHANPMEPYVIAISKAAGPVALAVGFLLAGWVIYSFM